MKKKKRERTGTSASCLDLKTGCGEGRKLVSSVNDKVAGFKKLDEKSSLVGGGIIFLPVSWGGSRDTKARRKLRLEECTVPTTNHISPRCYTCIRKPWIGYYVLRVYVQEAHTVLPENQSHQAAHNSFVKSPATTSLTQDSRTSLPTFPAVVVANTGSMETSHYRWSSNDKKINFDSVPWCSISTGQRQSELTDCLR